jgi:hypothetical protein
MSELGPFTNLVFFETTDCQKIANNISMLKFLRRKLKMDRVDITSWHSRLQDFGKKWLNSKVERKHETLNEISAKP